MDTLEDQRKFAHKHDLHFPLIADADAGICKAYGVFKEDWNLAGRATAVIGEDGTVLKTYPKAPLSGEGHAQRVYEDLAGLVE